MSNERIDEFLSWRSRLDDPCGVPGQGLDDREATWERLMDKIAGKPRRRRFFVYRMAAACVLLALVAAAGFFYDRHNRVVALRPVERQRAVAPGVSIYSPGAATGAGSAKHTPAGNAPVAATSRENAGSGDVAAAHMARASQELRGQAVPGQRRARHEQPAQQQPVQIAGLTTPPVVTPERMPDSVAAMTPKPLKNKTLRVIHINELSGAPGPLPAAITASDAAKRFEFFLVPGRTRMSLPPPPPATAAALLKIRLSSSN